MATSSMMLSRAPAATPAATRAARSQATQGLFRRWRQEGDARARDEIFRRHLPIARRLAGRYWNALEPFDDLYQVASIGLLGAMDRFDPERGVGFPAFAVPTILGELKRYFRDTGWSAHVPRRAQELARRVELASRDLSAQSHRPARVFEIAEYLEISTEDVVAGLYAGAAHHSVSLDTPVPGRTAEDAGSLGDSLGADDDRLALIDTTSALAAAVRQLSVQERRALRLRVQYELKQSEIAAQLGCSQMQVSRLLRSAAAKLHAATRP